MDRNFRPAAFEVKEMREQHGLSMKEAVRVLTKVHYMEACQQASTVKELGEVLFRFIEDTY